MPTYTFQEVSYPGTDDTTLEAINDAGVVAGSTYPSGSANGVERPNVSVPFTYSNGNFSLMPVGANLQQDGTTVPGGLALGYNNSGTLVGEYGNYAASGGGFIISNGSVSSASNGTSIAGISNNGIIVGNKVVSGGGTINEVDEGYAQVGSQTYTFGGSDASHAFYGTIGVNNAGNVLIYAGDNEYIYNIYSQQYNILSSPQGFEASPLAINDKNQIAGDIEADAFASGGFFFESGGIFYILNAPYGMPYGEDSSYLGLNNKGQIAASVGNFVEGSTDGFEADGFIATPGARTDDRTPVAPLNNVLLPAAAGPETVTVAIDAANGVLAGGGFVQTAPGLYTVVAPDSATAQADIQALVFTPTYHQVGPGQSVTTAFTLTVSNGGSPLSDNSTTVTAASTEVAAANTPPAIGGTVANQPDADGAPIHAFAAVTVTDPDAGQSETVTVSFAAGAGTLTGGGFAQTAPGVYSVTEPGGAAGAAAAAVQADLRAAVFTPTAGQSATTTLTVAVTDGQATVTDATTSVAATYTPPAAGGGGGGAPGSGSSIPSVDPLPTEFQNLARALLNGPDAQTAGTAINAAVQSFQLIDSQYVHSTIGLAQAEAALVQLVTPTTAVAVADYAFFTGFTPTAAGLDYLVHSSTNATDLNDAYYARFSTENRYINFAVNLATGSGAGAASFGASYGALSLGDATAKAYAAVFGTAADPTKVSAILNTLVPDGLGGQETRAQYFASYGGDGPNGQGTKAAAIGFLLAQAVETGAGVYGAATGHYLDALAHGIAPATGSELALTYGPAVNLVGLFPTADPAVTT